MCLGAGLAGLMGAERKQKLSEHWLPNLWTFVLSEVTHVILIPLKRS